MNTCIKCGELILPERGCECGQGEPPVAGSATGSAWVCVKDKLPNHLEQVIAIYAGVYAHRIVTFWCDDGGGTHFGHPCDLHGKGSQPATHWHPLPEMPHVRVSESARENPKL